MAEFDPQEFLRDTAQFDPQQFLAETAPRFNPQQFLAETDPAKPDVGLLNPLQQVGNAAVRGLVKGNIASPIQGVGALTGGSEAPDISPFGMVSAAGRAMFGPQPVLPEVPVQERPIYQAGAAVGDWAERQFPSDKSLHPIVEGVAGGLGQVGGLIGASMIPGVAPIAMGSTFLSGSGEAAERAIKEKATTPQVEQAAKWGNVAGSLDLADFMLSKMGKVGQFVAGASPSRITRGIMGALVEGGTEGAQEYIQNLIAKNIYKPNQDLWEGVPENAIVGAIVGGAVSTVLPQHRVDKPPEAADFDPVAERLRASAQSPEAQALARMQLRGLEAELSGAQPPTEPPSGPIGPSGTNARTPYTIYEPTKQYESSFSSEPRLMEGLRTPQPVFYSALSREADRLLPESATPEKILAVLSRGQDVKKEEMEATGFGAWLAGREGKVSKSDVMAFLEENQIRIETVVQEPSKYGFGMFNEPGPIQGAPIDILLKLPEKADTRPIEFRDVPDEGNSVINALAEALGLPAGAPVGNISRSGAIGKRVGFDPNYRGGHFREEANVFASVFGTRRITESGHWAFHVEGIQSDLHQKGVKYGYRTKEWFAAKEELDDLPRQYKAHDAGIKALEARRKEVEAGLGRQISTQETQDIHKQIMAHYAAMEANSKRSEELNKIVKSETMAVPDFPFKTNWTELAISRVLRWAADEGFSRVSFANPDLAMRYNTGRRGRDPGEFSGDWTPEKRKRLEKFYGEEIPRTLKRVANKFGGVLGATEIDLTVPGSEFPFEVRPTPREVNTPRGRERVMRWVIFDKKDSSRTFGVFATEADAIEGLDALRMDKGNPIVYFVDLPPAAKTAVQQGFAMFQKRLLPNEKKVSVVPDPNLIKAGAKFLGSAQKAVSVFETFAKKFGFGGKIKLHLQWNDGGGVRDEKGNVYPDAAGVQSMLPDGRYYIGIDASMVKGNTALLYTAMMHEFGHVVFWEKYDTLPIKLKRALQAEYDKYFTEVFNAGGAALDMFKRRTAATLQMTEYFASDEVAAATHILDLPFERQMYHMGFEEWFADRVAKWATTSEKPLGIVQKTFSEMANTLREYFNWMMKYLGIDTRPDQVMSDWLDSFLKTSDPMVSVIMKLREDLKSKKQNQSALAPGDANVELAEQRHQIEPIRNAMSQLFGSTPGGVPRPVREAAGHADRMNKMYEYAANLLQLVQANPNFTPLLRYAEKVGLWHLDESKGHNATLEISKDWRRLAKQSENLVALIDDLVQMNYRTADEVSRGVVRQYTLQEFQAMVAKHKVSAAGVQMHERLTKYFNDFLTLTSDVAKNDVLRKISDPVKQAVKLDEINAQITNLKNRPYFPFMHFGRYFVTVKDVNGKVMFFETFERRGLRSAEALQQKRKEEMVNLYGRDRVKDGVLDEHIAPLIGMPSTLLENIKDTLQLTPEQIEALELLQFEQGPSLSFKHRFKNPTYVPGYSHDFQRSFAKFGFHASRYLARSKWGPELLQHVMEAKAVGGNKESKIANYMSDHLRHNVQDARGDFGAFKAAVFIYAMGYVPAAATQNLLQTPIVTLPYLGAKFGDVRAAAALANAARQTSTFTRKGKLAGMTEFEMQALGYAIKTGRVSETQAAELMAISGGGNLVYATGGNWLQRGFAQVLEKAGFLFEIAEQFNRRIAFRAALNLAMQSPNAGIVNEAVRKYPDEYRALTVGTMVGGNLVNKYTDQQARAIVTANHIVEQTQFVYASYNQPKLMRGPIGSTVFIFKTYIQNLFALAGQNKRDFLPRFVVMSLLLGGAKALPGYDDLEDLVKALMRWMGHTEDPEVSMRRFIGQLTSPDGADLVLSGMARRGFGIPAMLDLMGSTVTGTPGRGLLTPQPGTNIPFPILDRSKSVSPGPLLPVQIGKILAGYGDPDKPIAEETQRAAGAGFSVGFNIIRAIADNSYEWTDPKRYERAVPRLFGWASKTYRAYSEGRERMRGGMLGAPTLTSYDPRDTEQLGEMIAMAMGYNSLRTSQHWDIIMAQRDQTKGLAMKREHLMKQFDEARRGGYEQELEKMRDSIRKWNTELSDEQKGYSISADQLRQSIVTREKDKILREMGLSSKKREIPVIRELQDVFPKWQTNPPVDAIRR